MNYIDLFSGIGGFALGAYWAGMRFENHFFSDIEKFAVELYQKRFPDAIPLGDITKIDTDKLIAEYGTDWVLTGGFPCQDISIAGKGAGIEGKRSGLWFEYWRLIRDLRPRIAIMENVGALTFRGLDTVLGTLSEIGYNAEWQDIRAEDVGAPHRRERIWIISYTTFERGKCRQSREPWEHSQRQEGLSGRSDPGGPPYANCKRLEGREKDGNTSESRENGEQLIERYGQCDGADSWDVEPNVGRLADGIPNRADRLKGLGNAIVPQIAMILWEQVKELVE